MRLPEKKQLLVALVLSCHFLQAEAVGPPSGEPLPQVSSAELRGDLSFLASDTLQGRYTPSPGLEAAAEFIASQFREIGLTPAGDSDYFQTAHMAEFTIPKLTSGLVVEDAGQSFTIPTEALAVLGPAAAAQVAHAQLVRIARMDPGLVKSLDLTGKAILVEQPNFRSMTHDEMTAAIEQMQAYQALVRQSKAALELVIVKRLNAPASQLKEAGEEALDSFPRLAVSASAANRLTTIGQNETVSIEIPAALKQPVTVKNVVGMWPGSDAALKKTYVLVTAHYDHIGTVATAARMANPDSNQDPNDQIYNGANDDGSGAVSVIEIARALVKLPVHPKRTLIFMTFFGEERGELGSEYYVSHPVVPISRTVADFNIEQVGRTDELDHGKIVKRINSMSATGFDYSGVTASLVRAGRRVGVNVYKDDEASDAYFRQSDNAAFADKGVPAHSITVAFDYPDYHGVGDDWRKIDYDNMARVDRAIALAALDVANARTAPAWSTQNPKTTPFREARTKQAADKD